MVNLRKITVIFISVLIMSLGMQVRAQTTQPGETFKARLSVVPLDVTMMSTVAGSGAVSATLTGKQLAIKGTFEGLRSPATTAQIRVGAKAMRGPAILDLTVTKAEKGAITGSFELTPEQIKDLKSGQLYVQIQSERAPDGNLWGWLLR